MTAGSITRLPASCHARATVPHITRTMPNRRPHRVARHHVQTAQTGTTPRLASDTVKRVGRASSGNAPPPRSTGRDSHARHATTDAAASRRHSPREGGEGGRGAQCHTLARIPRGQSAHDVWPRRAGSRAGSGTSPRHPQTAAGWARAAARPLGARDNRRGQETRKRGAQAANAYVGRRGRNEQTGLSRTRRTLPAENTTNEKGHEISGRNL